MSPGDTKSSINIKISYWMPQKKAAILCSDTNTKNKHKKKVVLAALLTYLIDQTMFRSSGSRSWCSRVDQAYQ
jgi:hypothetical protein